MMTRPGTQFWLRLAALFLCCVACVLPPFIQQRPARDILAVLDITGSMNVQDQSADGALISRISMEKRTVRTLLAALPCGSHLGIAVFVEAQPFLLFQPIEVCSNFAPIDKEIAAIDWRMGWDSESHIAETLRASLALAASLHSSLLFMTDGQETPPLAWSTAVTFDVASAAHPGLVVGVGGYRLAPIPKFDLWGRQIGYFKPGDVPSEHSGMFRGNEHLSAVDERHLRSLATEARLKYTHLENSTLPEFGEIRDVASEIRVNWLPACAALGLLAWSMKDGLWRFRRI